MSVERSMSEGGWEVVLAAQVWGVEVVSFRAGALADMIVEGG